MGEQRYSRWFTEWPSTHAWAGRTVEVMPVSEHEAELARLRAVEKAAQDVLASCAPWRGQFQTGIDTALGRLFRVVPYPGGER